MIVDCLGSRGRVEGAGAMLGLDHRQDLGIDEVRLGMIGIVGEPRPEIF